MTVHLVRTRTANIASVRAALLRCGADVRWIESASDIADAAAVVLPGVGTPHAALAALERDGLRDALAARLRDGAPTMAICLGLQLLAGRSDESPGIDLFGLFDAPVTRLPSRVRVPQLGWNHVDSDGWLPGGYAYYANSYCVAAEHFDSAREAGFEIAWSELSPRDRAAPAVDAPGAGDNAEADADQPVRFAAAIRRGDVLACQFHPELSGPWGAALIARWLEASAAA